MHPHRSSALGYASAASAAHSRVYGACAAEVAASESTGLSVGGCIRARRYFGPHPVYLLPCCMHWPTCIAVGVPLRAYLVCTVSEPRVSPAICGPFFCMCLQPLTCVYANKGL